MGLILLILLLVVWLVGFLVSGAEPSRCRAEQKEMQDGC